MTSKSDIKSVLFIRYFTTVILKLEHVSESTRRLGTTQIAAPHLQSFGFRRFGNLHFKHVLGFANTIPLKLPALTEVLIPTPEKGRSASECF